MSEKNIPNKITVTIKVVDGEQDQMEFNIYQTVEHMRHKALQNFEIDPPPGTVYHFLYQGRLLNESKTLEEEGVVDGAELLFGTEAQVG